MFFKIRRVGGSETRNVMNKLNSVCYSSRIQVVLGLIKTSPPDGVLKWASTKTLRKLGFKLNDTGAGSKRKKKNTGKGG